MTEVTNFEPDFSNADYEPDELDYAEAGFIELSHRLYIIAGLVDKDEHDYANIDRLLAALIRRRKNWPEIRRAA